MLVFFIKIKIRKECSIAINNISDSTGVSCEHANDAPVINYKLKKEKDISSMSRLTESDSADMFVSPILSCSFVWPQIGGLGRQSS